MNQLNVDLLARVLSEILSDKHGMEISVRLEHRDAQAAEKAEVM